MKTGIQLIADERQEQIDKHGYTLLSDQSYEAGELGLVAHRLISMPFDNGFLEEDMELMPEDWDEAILRKMMLKPYKERLIIAGALIAAEIDRLQTT